MRLKNISILLLVAMLIAGVVLVYAVWTPSGIELEGPTVDGTVDWDGGQRYFNCSFTEAEVGAVNVSIYTNFTGVWGINATREIAGGVSLGPSYNFTFNLSKFSDFTGGVWTCQINQSNTNNFSDTNWTFSLDTTAPLAFNLSNVTYGVGGTVGVTNTSIAADRGPTFAWNATAEDHFINYTFQIANASTFATASLVYEKEIVGGVSNNSVNLSAETGDANYLPADIVLYWRVIAYENSSSGRDPTYSSQNFTFTTDNSMQAITILSPAVTNLWNNSGWLNITYNATDNSIDTCWLGYSLNGAASVTRVINDSSAAVTDAATPGLNISLNDGNYTFFVECNDTQGNWGNSSTRTIFMDNTTPTLTLNFSAYVGAAGTLTAQGVNHNGTNYTSRTVYFGFTATETNPETCSLYVNQTAWKVNQTIGTNTIGYNTTTATYFASPVTFSADGTYLFDVMCNDTAKNLGNASSITFNVDATDPAITALSPGDNNWSAVLGNVVIFNYTVTDTFVNNCTIWSNFNGTWQANVSNSSTTDITSGISVSNNITIPDGTDYIWNVLCYDHSGRSSWFSTNYTLNVDTTLPTEPVLANVTIGSTEIGNNTVGNTLNPTVNWAIVTETNFKNYTIQFSDTNTFANINSTIGVTTRTTNTTIITTALTQVNKTYYWRVIAFDDAGNSNTSTHSYVYRGDNLAPTIRIEADSPTTSSAAKGYDSDGSVRFSYTPNDHNPSDCFLYANFSGTFMLNESNRSVSNAQTYNITIPNLKNGTYAWNVWCNDSAVTPNSAWNLTTANYTLVVDSEAPTISSTNNTVTSDRQISFTVTEAGNALINHTTIGIIPWNYTSTASNFNNATDCTSSDGNQTLTCVYTETALVSGINYLSITARDNANNLANYTLYITTAGANNFSLSLASGWNLVSTPLILTTSTIDNVVANNSNVRKIYTMNATGTNWLSWDSSNPSGADLTTMEPRKGYWINTTATTTLPLFGAYTTGTPPQSYQGLELSSGWHTIGSYDSGGNDNIDTADALAQMLISGCGSSTSLSCYVFSVLRYGASLTLADSASFGADNIWDRGQGFFIYMNQTGNYIN